MGKAWDTELAHEVGHNLGLRHAPCGGALGTDESYPYPNGSTGVWGYDFRDSTLVSPENRRDIMGYCYEVGWLSDYYFEKVIAHREEKEGTAARDRMAVAGPESEMLVLWGGVVDGELRIEPSFSMQAAARLAEAAGPYRDRGDRRHGRERILTGLHARRGPVRQQVLLLHDPDRGALGGIAGPDHADRTRGRRDGGRERPSVDLDRDRPRDRANPRDPARLGRDAAGGAGGDGRGGCRDDEGVGRGDQATVAVAMGAVSDIASDILWPHRYTIQYTCGDPERKRCEAASFAKADQPPYPEVAEGVERPQRGVPKSVHFSVARSVMSSMAIGLADRDARKETELRDSFEAWIEQVLVERTDPASSRGRPEGVERGRREGIERKRALVRRLAARRFGSGTVERLGPLQDRLSDPERIAAIAEAVVECETAEEFMARTRRG